MNLVIVESPTKSKTIEKFLGSNYKVLSSYGHIRDLPKSELGIDTEKNFEPRYIIPTKSKKRVTALKKEAEKADLIILATDEDREGEAIAWHLLHALKLDKTKKYQRIAFHEITKQAIEQAIKNPRDINIDIVNAQQARRILDRLVGYKLSPFLWKKVTRGLSAGRVQSVAVRLICEREEEVKNFNPEEYWTIEAELEKQNAKNQLPIKALLAKKDKKLIPKLGIKIKKETEDILKDLKNAEYKIIDIQKKEQKRNPLPPFITSTLQREAYNKLHWSTKFTMRTAQGLYEKGFITYHRTDSLNIANSALSNAQKYIEKIYGKNYWAGSFKKYKTKAKGAQEAHEAIRPSYPDKEPNKLKLDEKQAKLYDLIWRRFIASQMSQAIFDSTTIDIEAKNYIFKTTGQILKFEGFLKLYPMKFEQNKLPELEANETLNLLKLIPDQHFTQPPARYSEATLIKVLEENGIGRPSTYAPVISTIEGRNYIQKNEQKKFEPTEIGVVVNDLLVKHFPKIVDIQFTAKMEQNLDEISEGKKEWVPIVREFYNPFAERLAQKEKEISKADIAEQKTDKKCPKCGSMLLIKLGRFGKFYACSKFPECKYSAPLEEKDASGKDIVEEKIDKKCPKCGEELIVKAGRFGKFYACSAFPKCKHTEAFGKSSLDINCPKCGTGNITEKRTKRGKIFYACDEYPKCDFALWDKPTGGKCPKCDSLLIETKKNITKCSSKDCNYIKK